MKDFIPQNIEERIVLAMARALWASVYADAYENGDIPGDDDHAGPGQDWMDHCGELPVRALMVAQRLADVVLIAARDQAKTDTIKPRHIACLWQVFGEAMEQNEPSINPNSYEEVAANGSEIEDFGHYLAMESMGHGVGWSDDHEDLPFTVPNTLEHLSWHDLKD